MSFTQIIYDAIKTLYRKKSLHKKARIEISLVHCLESLYFNIKNYSVTSTIWWISCTKHNKTNYSWKSERIFLIYFFHQKTQTLQANYSYCTFDLWFIVWLILSVNNLPEFVNINTEGLLPLGFSGKTRCQLQYFFPTYLRISNVLLYV